MRISDWSSDVCSSDLQAKCWECHGQTGEGDGEKAAGLTDDWGFPIRPADLTTGQFKSGPAVEDIFRTMTNGLVGTPMPSYGRALPEEDRWALPYYVLALSAFTDPLTGEPLPTSPQDRAALNDPALKAPADRKRTRLTSSHECASRMPSYACKTKQQII